MTAPEWIDANWDAPAGVRAVFTTRIGGVSTGPYASLNLSDRVGDSPDAVAANTQRLIEALDLPQSPAWLWQVHGAEVVTNPSCCAEPPEADAAICNPPDRVLGIQTADCLPVALASSDGRCIGAAHAGWRGLVAGVVPAAVRAMDCAPGELHAWLGPCIGAGAYEIDAPVRDALLRAQPAAEAAMTGSRPGHWLADLRGIARLQLQAAGVNRIAASDACTASDSERYYSYRRDDGRCGRQALLVWFDKADR